MSNGSYANGFRHEEDKLVDANLNFYLDPSKGGRDSFAIGTAGAYKRKFDEKQISIRDVRGRKSDFDLDTHGFQWHKRSSIEKDFTDDQQVKAVAYLETEQLLKDV